MKTYQMSDDAIEHRIQNMLSARNVFEKRILEEDWFNVAKELKLQRGNSKTGYNCRTISLLPIIDCMNCSLCRNYCYDVRNDCRLKNVILDRAKNSALHKTNPEMFWKFVGILVHMEMVFFLRINVGGDLTNEDMLYIQEYVCRPNKSCTVMYFTKNLDGLDFHYERLDGFLDNEKPLRSRWEGDGVTENKHNIPEAWVVFPNKPSHAPNNAKPCGGNCSWCHFNGTGCPNAEYGDAFVFNAH